MLAKSVVSGAKWPGFTSAPGNLAAGDLRHDMGVHYATTTSSVVQCEGTCREDPVSSCAWAPGRCYVCQLHLQSPGEHSNTIGSHPQRAGSTDVT